MRTVFLRNIAVLAQLFFLPACCLAQSGAGSLFAKTAAQLEKDGASIVKGSSTSSYGESTAVQDFDLSLSGDKFFMVLEDGETTAWFDSKTLWNAADYGDGIEEIYISVPTQDDVILLNPSRLLSSADMFKITEKGKDTFVMEPKKKGELVFGLSKATVRVNTQTFRPVQIDLVLGGSGKTDNSIGTVSLRIQSWQPGQKFQDTMFTCPVSKYPDAEIIDLR